MMLAEITDLLRAVPNGRTLENYRETIVDQNVLGKKTLATRKLTLQRLAELYGLDVNVPLFRIFKNLWNIDREGRSLLALLVAYARDPLLRATSEVVLNAVRDSTVPVSDLDHALSTVVGKRLNPSVRHKVARNAASTWTQSGHLIGRARKRRSTPIVTPAAVTLALILSYVQGARGASMLKTDAVRLLDVSHVQLVALIQAASRQSLLDFKQLGDLLEIRFPSLLTPDEEGMCNGGN